MTTESENTTLRNRVTDIVSAGLVVGLGHPIPGEMCLEAAICLALGESHGDSPSCVALPDRNYAMALQDAYPGTIAERAALFLPLGLAQLGTSGSDRGPWLRRLVAGTIGQVLPFWLLRAAEKNDTHAPMLRAAAARCALEQSAASAYAAAASAYAAASSASSAYAAAADAADAAASSADSSAYAARAAARAADDAYASCASRRTAIEMSVAIALEAYAAEGRS
jgi:hypothetical protein